MSDVVWHGVVAILFIAGFACAAYSGWQVFCPMRFRRIYVVYLTSQKLRARGEKYFWYASFVASILECTGIALALQQNSASVIVAAGGGIIAVVGFAVDSYYAYMAGIVRNEEIAEAVSDHHRELEAAAVR